MEPACSAGIASPQCVGAQLEAHPHAAINISESMNIAVHLEANIEYRIIRNYYNSKLLISALVRRLRLVPPVIATSVQNNLAPRVVTNGNNIFPLRRSTTVDLCCQAYIN